MSLNLVVVTILKNFWTFWNKPVSETKLADAKTRAHRIEAVVQSSHLKPPAVPDRVDQQWDGVMSFGTWRQLCLCRLWDVWSVARVRLLAAMSRFIGFNKAECANNCHWRRGAKPPHLSPTDWRPLPLTRRGPLRTLPPPPRRSPLCPWPACCCAGVCVKAAAGGALAGWQAPRPRYWSPPQWPKPRFCQTPSASWADEQQGEPESIQTPPGAECNLKLWRTAGRGRETPGWSSKED